MQIILRADDGNKKKALVAAGLQPGEKKLGEKI
jgi:hypothetical protein